MAPSYVLVTGATGFIGAHVVDKLLSSGLKVRGATRSLQKGQVMLDARPQYKDQLDFVQISDFESAEGNSAIWTETLKGIDGVIHVASPLKYDTTDNEKELILPAITGIKSLLSACRNTAVQRIVITSSFASVIDINRKAPPYFTYTADDWNPLTYVDSIAPTTDAVVAYRGSKKFAELAAWDFVKTSSPSFDIVTLCPPMTFGPIAHPITRAFQLNESNSQLWKVASGALLPVSRVPFWVDVRDLAIMHVEALLKSGAGGKRYIPASPERFSYGLAAEIIRSEFEWADVKGVSKEMQQIDGSYGLDGETAAKALGVKYRGFRECVVDLIKQVTEMEEKAKETEEA